jgi:hypothetical protein
MIIMARLPSAAGFSIPYFRSADNSIAAQKIAAGFEKRRPTVYIFIVHRSTTQQLRKF